MHVCALSSDLNIQIGCANWLCGSPATFCRFGRLTLLNVCACGTNWMQMPAAPTGCRCLQHQLDADACSTNRMHMPAAPTGCRCLQHQLDADACSTNWMQMPAAPTGCICLQNLLDAYACRTGHLHASQQCRSRVLQACSKEECDHACPCMRARSKKAGHCVP